MTTGTGWIPGGSTARSQTGERVARWGSRKIRCGEQGGNCCTSRVLRMVPVPPCQGLRPRICHVPPRTPGPHQQECHVCIPLRRNMRRIRFFRNVCRCIRLPTGWQLSPAFSSRHTHGRHRFFKRNSGNSITSGSTTTFTGAGTFSGVVHGRRWSGASHRRTDGFTPGSCSWGRVSSLTACWRDDMTSWISRFTHWSRSCRRSSPGCWVKMRCWSRESNGPGLREDERNHRFACGDPAAFYGYNLGERKGAGFETGIPVVDKDDAFVCEQDIVQPPSTLTLWVVRRSDSPRFR